MSNSTLTPPAVLWAQRKNLIYLNIALEDTKDPTIKIEEKQVYFRGVGGTENKEHEVTIALYEAIDVAQSRHIVRQRNVEFVLIKQDEKYWPHLLKDKTKMHWLKIDFNKWKDEDESDEDEELGANPGAGGSNFNFEELMAKMGSDGGMAGQDFNVDEPDQVDSDDEALPDLE